MKVSLFFFLFKRVKIKHFKQSKLILFFPIAVFQSIHVTKNIKRTKERKKERKKRPETRTKTRTKTSSLLAVLALFPQVGSIGRKFA